MVYRRSHDIEKRLEEILRLISGGGYATPALAKLLHVSIPTVSRCVTALRERGYDIRAVKQADGWQYILHGAAEKPAKRRRHAPSRFPGAARP
jgi:transposase